MTPLEYRMHTDTHQLIVALLRREVLVVQVDERLRVSCLLGRLWITQHHHGDDIVLEAGASIELSHKGQAVVQALSPARLALKQTGAGFISGLETNRSGPWPRPISSSPAGLTQVW